jgi:MarR family transcriptional regulator, transcriptional regulator for hemolysin
MYDIISGMKIFDPEKSIGFLIYDVSRLMRRNFDAQVKPLGLTQIQWRAIAHITRQEGCNQATLADQLEIKPITLTRLIDRLVEAGWVTRQPDPKDRRAVQIHLTEKSRPLLQTMQEKSLQTRAEALQEISDDDFEVLFRTLKKMKSNLSK